MFCLQTITRLNTLIRDKMFDIYPATLDDLGLGGSLRILIDEMKKKLPKDSILKIQLHISNDFTNPEQFKLQIFRMIKELVQNAIKYSEANNIRVTLTQDQQYLSIKVIDDGTGFDSSSVLKSQNSQLGLRSIKYEVSQLKGEFQIKTTKGTQVTIKLPLKSLLGGSQI